MSAVIAVEEPLRAVIAEQIRRFAEEKSLEGEFRACQNMGWKLGVKDRDLHRMINICARRTAYGSMLYFEAEALFRDEDDEMKPIESVRQIEMPMSNLCLNHCLKPNVAEKIQSCLGDAWAMATGLRKPVKV